MGNLLYKLLMVVLLTLSSNTMAWMPTGCEDLKERKGSCIEDYRVIFSDAYKGDDAVMPFKELKALVKEVQDRFTYSFDKDNPVGGTKPEYWRISKDGKPFMGDCEDIALTIRYELGKRGYSSHLLGVDDTQGLSINHAILQHGPYLLSEVGVERILEDSWRYTIMVKAGLSDNEGWFFVRSNKTENENGVWWK